MRKDSLPVAAQVDATARSTESHKIGGKFLSFFLAKEEYGIEILKVQQIIGMMPITRVPHTPDSIRGVINLRGKVIPIIDLRLKFGMASMEQTEQTCIIVVRTSGVELGVVVDRVSEVLDIPTKDIEAAPSFGSDVDTEYILGIGKSDGKVKLLLDIDKVLTDRQKMEIQALPAIPENPALESI